MCLAAIGRVLSVGDIGGALVADVSVDDKVMRIGADLTPGIGPGTYVVIHAGMAIEALSPEQAADALDLRAEIARAAEG